MMEIEDHLFKKGESVSHLSCPKNTVKFAPGQPDTIIIHYTAGKSGESSAKYLCRKKVKASAHIVLDRSGHIYQLVPFDTVTWHAGKSSYEGRSGFNKFSIGIEIDNAGVLEKVGNKYKSWFGKTYPEEEVMQAVHRNESASRFWHTYTEVQIDKTIEMIEALMDRYPTITNILGHEEISKGRKQDPGPAFPLDKVRNGFLESREEELPMSDDYEGIVDVPRLNIREMPSGSADLAAAPLEGGTKLKVLQQHNGWLKVETKIEGWVAGQYVDIK
ncbi:N-acetylmuramoyl-L-alanine amidase [Reichenbachiella versicolor]|uniref:N-acetylmuramoyl-L-alanine amidase n=1 Tax=Reichenbachiella versicolor TaxID=1821036 RepID=UPI000D6EAF26|nr:N-acetylmuramoyl-L-alanine amidase [Reichenbachiella versicolor]